MNTYDNFIKKIIEIKTYEKNTNTYYWKIFELFLKKEHKSIFNENIFNELIKIYDIKNYIEKFYEKIIEVFKGEYSFIIGSICLSICFDSKKNDFINLDYEKDFENKLKNHYDNIYTTNYYLGKINNHSINFCLETNCNNICKKIKFLHGKIQLCELRKLVKYIQLKKEAKILKEYFGNGIEKNEEYFNEFKEDKDKNEIYRNLFHFNLLHQIKWKILFGENLKHKEFLNKLLDLNYDFTSFKLDENKTYKLDIVGLSTLADEVLLKNIFEKKNINEINVFYHTNKDKEDYINLINKLDIKSTNQKQIDNEHILFSYENKIINLIKDEVFFNEKIKSNIPNNPNINEKINANYK